MLKIYDNIFDFWVYDSKILWFSIEKFYVKWFKTEKKNRIGYNFVFFKNYKNVFYKLVFIYFVCNLKMNKFVLIWNLVMLFVIYLNIF